MRLTGFKKMLSLTATAASFTLISATAHGEGFYVRADLVGGKITDTASSTATNYNFRDKGTGFGLRGGVMRKIGFVPFLEAGPEMRLAYLPLKDTDRTAAYKTGIQFGAFSRLQLAQSVSPLQPYAAIGTSGIYKNVKAVNALNQLKQFQMSLTGAVGADFRFAESGFVLGIDAAATRGGPKTLRGSIGYNF